MQPAVYICLIHMRCENYVILIKKIQIIMVVNQMTCT